MEKQVINFDESIIVKAFNFAKKYHEGQVRKGTDTPYIVHPFNVFTILESMNADTNLLIAGLLHDTLEDTKATKEEILELFNEDVLFLVLNHTEDKKYSWDERKTKEINELKETDRRTKMLIMADTLANLRNMQKDYKLVNEKLWDRFKAPKEKQYWYYKEKIKAIEDTKDDINIKHVYKEIVDIFNSIFVF